MEKIHQLLLNMLVTKDIKNKVFDHIDPWGKTLASIALEIRSSYHRTIISTLGQAVLGRDMLSNLTSVVYWQVVTAANKQQVNIDNVRGKSRQVTHDYEIGNQVCVEINSIYSKIDYKKQKPYIIT